MVEPEVGQMRLRMRNADCVPHDPGYWDRQAARLGCRFDELPDVVEAATAPAGQPYTLVIERRRVVGVV